MLGRSFRGAMKALTVASVFVACNTDPGMVLGSDRVTGPPGFVPPNSGTVQHGDGSSPVVGDTCRTSDSNRICLALKYVVYEDTSGKPVVSQAAAIENIRQINSVWAQCNLGFQIEQFVAADPSAYALQFNTANMTDLDDIRNKFQDRQTLLLVTTGRWNRTGTLGSYGANAWTSMPGWGPFGAVLEQPVGGYSPIIGHELGHYLNLGHLNDTSDLMNPVIYTTSNRIDGAQCAAARSAANYYWPAMQR